MVLGRAIKEASLGLYRTGTVALLSSVAIGASLLLVGVFAQILEGAHQAATILRDRVEVEIYLKAGTPRRAAVSLATDLRQIDGVADVAYVDKATAAEEFREMFGDAILSALSTNPLPASLRVGFLGDAAVMRTAGAVVALGQDHRWVEQVETGQTWMTEVERVIDVGTWIVLFLGLVLCTACGFVVSNTAKLMVLAQREAIEIMRVVGATNGFIRSTFMMGGGLQGAFGGGLACMALLMGSPILASALPFESTLPPGLVGLLLVGLGALLGVVGSWVSLNRVLQAVG